MTNICPADNFNAINALRNLNNVYTANIIDERNAPSEADIRSGMYWVYVTM